MSPNARIRLLFVPDKISGQDSGAASARFTASSLAAQGYDVAVYAPDGVGPQSEAGYRVFKRQPSTSLHHFVDGAVRAEFEEVLATFAPDHVFFAGATPNKPRSFFCACLERGIPYALLFYITDYYCMKVYAGLRGGPCLRCAGGNYSQALVNDCPRGRPKLLQFIKSALVLWRLKPLLLKCSKVIGYSDNQLGVYREYGFSSEKCVKSPVHFDGSHISGAYAHCGDYFVIAGQSTVEKGWHLLSEIIALCPGVKFKAIFSTPEIARAEVERFGLGAYVRSGQVEVVTGLVDHKDFLAVLAGARGVLVPTYYPTTGEFLLMESLALGKPAIVFKSGAHADMIRSGENGFMADIGDIQSYAGYINALFFSETLYHKVSGPARILFDELTSRERFAAAMTHVFPPRGNGDGHV